MSPTFNLLTLCLGFVHWKISRPYNLQEKHHITMNTYSKCSSNRTAWQNHFVCSEVLTSSSPLAVIACCQGDSVHLPPVFPDVCVCGEGRWTTTSCHSCFSGPWCGWWWLSTCSSVSTCFAHCAAGATGDRSQTWRVQRSRGLMWWTFCDTTHVWFLPTYLSSGKWLKARWSMRL